MDGLVSAISEIAREIVRQELAKLQAAMPAPIAPPADDGERLLSVAAVAERTARSEATVRRWIADGVLPTVALPGRVKGREITCVRQSDLDRWIRGLPLRVDARPEVPGDLRVPRRPAARRAVAGRAPTSGLDAEIQKLHAQRGVGRSPRHRQSAAL